MPLVLFRLACIACIGAVCALGFGAAASGQPQGQQPRQAPKTDFIALGAGAVPEYDGAEDLQPIPVILGRVSIGGARYVSLQGLTLSANLVNDRQFEAGPLVSFNFGRDDSVDNPAIAALTPVDDAIEVGGFVGYSWNGVGHPRGQLRLGANMRFDASNAYDGWQSQASVTYSRIFGRKFRLGTTFAATYVDGNYADTYFSVNPTDSALSGLAVFDAGSGVKDIGLSANASYRLNADWALIGFAGVSRFMGDFADSPIIREGGERNQVRFGLSIGRFF